MVAAQHGEAVERDVFDEPDEGLAQRIERTVKVHVLGIDVSHHCYGGRKFNERTVRFIRLNNDPVAFAEMRVGTVRVDNSTVYHGWVEFGRIEEGGHD